MAVESETGAADKAPKSNIRVTKDDLCSKVKQKGTMLRNAIAADTSFLSTLKAAATTNNFNTNTATSTQSKSLALKSSQGTPGTRGGYKDLVLSVLKKGAAPKTTV